MDLTDSIAPASDQLDAIELIAGPRTFTITSVSAGSAEQPVDIRLAEFPRVWRPSKGMRRVLVAAWGPDAAKYAGRKVVLFFDPDVSFGKERTGGTRISHMTDLPSGKRMSIPLLISRGKSAMFVVEPLTEPAPPAPAPTGPSADDIAACTDLVTLRGWWQSSSADGRAQISARVSELTEPAPDADPWAETAAKVAARDADATP